MKSELLQIRVSPELKNRLKEKGDMSAYLRSLVEEDLGLNNGDAAFGDSQAQAERVGASTSPSVPVAEPPSKTYEPHEPPKSFSDSLQPVVLVKLIKQLEAQGKEPAEARKLAKQRLGL